MYAMIAAALLVGAPAPMPTAAGEGRATEVLAIERQRFDAQVGGDAARLGAFIADDAVYIHANGTRQTKQQYLADVAAGKSRYARIDASDTSASFPARDVAVSHGTYTLTFGDGRSITARYTGVYVRQAGHWMVESWQSTPVQPPR